MRVMRIPLFESLWHGICSSVFLFEEGIEVEDALPITWTSEAPTEPGWYWFALSDYEWQIVRVVIRPGHKYMCISAWGSEEYIRVNGIVANWAGPIPEPTIPVINEN
ncbi:MAG: hypothetical protein GY799_13045 [Desulfobulbaceae bacterium]|nr:hypothetical protein [Desulfobulbaceae bacterium]